MHCRTCDYSLWTIRPGPCPECGTPFRPSDYRFRVGNVAFRCPHCGQRYYGTSTMGQLEPSAFACVGCGNALTTDEMTIEPAPGIAEEDTGVLGLAWFERKKLGLWRAWYRTVLRTLGAPADAMRTVPATAPLSEPIFFAATTSALTTAIGLVFAVIGVTVGGLAASMTPQALARLLAAQVGVFAMNMLFAVVATLVGGVAGHAALLALRAAHGGFNRSMQACLFASGAAYAVFLVPCPCLYLVGPVWWGVCVAAMYRVGHSTTLPRAVTAAIVALIVATVASVSLALVPQGLGFSKSWVQFSTVSTSSAADSTADAFEEAAASGAWPATPLDLVASGAVHADEFLRMTAPIGDDQMTVAGLDAKALRSAAPEVIRAAASGLAAKLPPNDAPFRIGRSVFYYRDASRDADDADWLVVIEPRRNHRGALTSNIWTVMTLGSTERLTMEEFAEALKARTAARTARGRSGPADPATLADVETGALPALPAPKRPTESR